MSIFNDLASLVAQMLGTTTAQAGMLLGAVLVFIMVAIIIFIMGRDVNIVGMAIMAAIGMAVNIVVGWWDPIWAILVVIVLVTAGVFVGRDASGA